MKLELSSTIKAADLAVRQKFIHKGVEHVRLHDLLEVAPYSISAFNLVSGEACDVPENSQVEPRGDYLDPGSVVETTFLELIGEGKTFRIEDQYYMVTDDENFTGPVCVHLESGRLRTMSRNTKVIAEHDLVITRKGEAP